MVINFIQEPLRGVFNMDRGDADIYMKNPSRIPTDQKGDPASAAKAVFIRRTNSPSLSRVCSVIVPKQKKDEQRNTQISSTYDKGMVGINIIASVNLKRSHDRMRHTDESDTEK